VADDRRGCEAVSSETARGGRRETKCYSPAFIPGLRGPARVAEKDQEEG